MNRPVKIVEADIDAYFILQVTIAGGITERIQYRGKRGAADHLTGFPYNRLFLVELKRPKGGKIRIAQLQDAVNWFHIGVEKVYLRNHAEVDRWIKKVRA